MPNEVMLDLKSTWKGIVTFC